MFSNTIMTKSGTFHKRSFRQTGSNISCRLTRKFSVLKLRGCFFFCKMTSHMSIDQGNFDFFVHDAFKPAKTIQS